MPPHLALVLILLDYYKLLYSSSVLFFKTECLRPCMWPNSYLFSFTLKVTWRSRLGAGEEPLVSLIWPLPVMLWDIFRVSLTRWLPSEVLRTFDSGATQNVYSWECKPWASTALSGQEDEDGWLARAAGPLEKLPMVSWRVAVLRAWTKVWAVVLETLYRYWFWPPTMVIEHPEGHLHQYLRTNSAFKLSCW